VLSAPQEPVYSPLAEAVFQNDACAVKNILRGGGNANEKVEIRPYGVWTVLSMASAQGYTKIARLLMAHGADVNEGDRAGSGPLMKAAWNGHPETVRALIDGGAALDAGDCGGYTALMLSITGCKIESARVLIDNGADVHVRNSCGETALSLAKNYNDPETIQLIKDAPEIQRRIAAEVQAALEAIKAQHDLAVERQQGLKRSASKPKIIRGPQP
jgi:ankyrin repeat protein